MVNPHINFCETMTSYLGGMSILSWTLKKNDLDRQLDSSWHTLWVTDNDNAGWVTTGWLTTCISCLLAPALGKLSITLSSLVKCILILTCKTQKLFTDYWYHFVFACFKMYSKHVKLQNEYCNKPGLLGIFLSWTVLVFIHLIIIFIPSIL